MSKRNKSAPGHRIIVSVTLFFFLSFLLVALPTGSAEGFLRAGAFPCLVLLSMILLPRLFQTDHLLTILVIFLNALSVLLCDLLDSSSVPRQAAVCGAGLLNAILCAGLVRRISWRRAPWLILPISLLPAATALLFGFLMKSAGESAGGIPSVSFLQPAEIGKPALVIAASWLLSRRKHLFFLLFSVLCLALLLLDQDFGNALLYWGTALLLFWASSGNLLCTLACLGAGIGIAWYGSRISPSLQLASAFRPGQTAVEAGSQMTQEFSAIAEGGLWGTGLRVESSVPGVGNDSLFPVLCQRFGFLFVFSVLLICAVMILRGSSIAATSRRNFHSLLAMGSVVMLGLQIFAHTGGALGLIPWLGVPFPFLSGEVVPQIVSMCLTGMILGVHALQEDYLSEDARIAMLDR